MRNLLLFMVLLMSVTPFPILVGCGGAEETAAPEKMEENRQKAIQRAKRMQEEMSKK